MSKVAIVTDSISHMPQELADKYDIKIVPMGIVIEGKAYPETEVDLPEYYQKLLQITENEKLPTSSSVTVGSFLEALRELSQKAEGIVYIGHSIRLGMSTNAATQAKKMVEEEMPDTPIEVIDSGTALGAQAFIVVEAAKAAAEGKKLHVVINHINVPDEAEELKKKVLSQFNCVEFYVTPTYPVVGRHVGPGTQTISWWAED